MTRAFVIIYFLFCNFCSWSQDVPSGIEGTYKTLKIYFKNNSIPITVKDATITADSIHFREYLSHRTRDLSLSEVRRINNYKGNHARKGASIGLGALELDIQLQRL